MVASVTSWLRLKFFLYCTEEGQENHNLQPEKKTQLAGGNIHNDCAYKNASTKT